jgi:hypothetical protein
MNNSVDITSIHKKFPSSFQYKPLGIINKKLSSNSNNNNNNLSSQNIEKVNPNQNFFVNHNLPKFGNKNNQNITLLDKIKKNINGENFPKKFIPKNIKINQNDSIKTTEQKKNEDVWDNEIDENIPNKESSGDEAAQLSEEGDKIEEGNKNSINSINKISSIKIHPNFIRTHCYSKSGISMNSNNSQSNSSTNRENYYTEPEEFSKIHLNESFGRSNYSTNMNIPKLQNFYEGSPMIGIQNFNMLYGPFRQNRSFWYQNKGSFLSTNTNSHNQSGQKFDSSLSNESGQSPHILGNNYPSLQYNNSMTNIKNNTFLFPLTGNITPVDNRHVYTNSFHSNENLFKQLFSFNKFNTTKQTKIPINLEKIAIGKEMRTTVMIRNLPIKYTDQLLEKELKNFDGKFDCMYMPYDFDNQGNKGYAFVNFKSPYNILLFYDMFNGKSWSFCESKKICELNFANFQGINEISKHAKNYKGSKKPRFYISTNNDNNIIEIPIKYLDMMIKANPNMKYIENKRNNSFMLTSLN